MANTVLNPTIIAKAAVRILDNELVMANRVYRGYEDEFKGKVNGYDKGDTLTIRKPNDFTVRNGSVASVQDVTEGKETFVVDTVKGVDFKFTSQQLTLNISDLSERVIKPAMIQLANQIDIDLLSLYKDVYNWVGTPGQNIDSFSDFSLAPERLDLCAVPQDGRMAVLSPTDHRTLRSAATALFMQDVARGAYRKGMVGDIDDVETYKSQNVQTFTCGSRDNTTPLVDGGAQNVTYASVMNTETVPGTSTLVMKGAGTSHTIKQGDVFTIFGVYAVNPVTKAKLPFLQQFVVRADITMSSGGAVTPTIAPAIITSGPKQTVDSVPADGAAITWLGTASTGYAQNMVFRKEAFGLIVVPMVKPPGAVDMGRETYKGISVRVIPVYDGINDYSMWRLDVLYGKKTLDPRQATRISGTA